MFVSPQTLQEIGIFTATDLLNPKVRCHKFVGTASSFVLEDSRLRFGYV